MAKKARQRISYVLENAKSSAGGHRLGVNGLAVDASNGILYSGGRDGILCAWDLDLDSHGAGGRDAPRRPTTRLRAQTQAHMHWINDIALAQNNTALVSASSDLAVKLWRPYSEEDRTRAHTIGEHADYVKCVATPPADINANWVASGGLDRKIRLWDLDGAGKTLEVDIKGEEVTEKGSVYALAVGRSILASGGPDKMVRLYDPRTGSKVSKLVGHLDNIRSILIDDAGDIILSAGADKTIKMWSVRGGRCMYTFTMHDESIWSLYSDDPRLGIFYSSDRSGLVAKTDVRSSLEDMDDGLSLAVVQENFGVSKVVAAAGHIWTATNRSSINRWGDIDTSGNIKLPQDLRHERASATASNGLVPPYRPETDVMDKREITPESVLRLSSTAVFSSRSNRDPDSVTIIRPIHQVPEETIEGQFGLLKHKMLNDRRRVLTLDTAGDVLLWDLIACKPIQSFGKQHLEDVDKAVNTREAVAPWCSVDLSSGNLTVVLEPFNCFDAEVYADELKWEEPLEFKEDQRIILGRWILRYLFANLISEEIKRDELYRQKLNDEAERRHAASRPSAPISIDLPQPSTPSWQVSAQDATPRPNAPQLPVPTPGLAIGLATPGLPGSLPSARQDGVSGSWDRGLPGEREDYFAADRTARAPATPATDTSETRVSHENGAEKGKERDRDKGPDKGSDNGKSPGTPFGRKFRMSFSSKKLRSLSQATQEKPAVAKDGTEESESSSTHEKEVDDSFFGVLQKIRQEYDKQLAESPEKPLETQIRPSLPTETPVLKLPAGTRVIIQEETSGGSANIYQGTVEDIGRDVDIIEQKAPMWLGDVLLRNYISHKEPIKVSFILHPMSNLPPISPADGTNRLNANRMLRVKKILAYVAERLDELLEDQPDGLKPEDYLELYCNDQLLGHTMSLATIRAHIWKGGSDVVMYYKATGRRNLKPRGQPSPTMLLAEEGGAAAQPTATAAAVSEAGTAAQAS
ncbi:WD repeat protein [Hirsutella rhossiliensis]|uniref:WD repeat protein n=1 Tax=Hirsutella rhossiliensis TaxID=111463 RepID=A0A9P8N9M7_9HYPO|nr:WD repeat protein [Hirsutella rhossiliensis]KAH0968279.1 WD repeat protein [Hirsutella rhossiliensis]